MNNILYSLLTKSNKYLLGLCLACAAFAMSCNKLVQIPPPIASITASQVFSDSADATSAIAGIYDQMIQTGSSVAFGDGLITLYGGLSADELTDYFDQYPLLDYNKLTITSGLTDGLWDNAYTYMYPINSSIESIQGSLSLDTTVKNQLIGECKFMRALCYFYLVNLYGDVPLLLTSNYQTNDVAARTPKAQVYQQMVSDLKDAQNLLRADYSISGGNRIRANQAAATALLARVYLYTNDWSDAITSATTVINNPAYSLVKDLNGVFLANSNEAILQWQLNPTAYPYNVTPEGYNFVPSTGYPTYFTINSLLQSAFEPGDLRFVNWVDSTNWQGAEQYFPYKYKVGPSQATPNGNVTEYYMVLRLAEQYLIRAEAEEAMGSTGAAIADLNIIRSRAGLAPLPATLTSIQARAAVMQERRIELFAEWGHRWFDLKRTGAIDSVMTIATPLKGGGNTWQSFQEVYPIPLSEIRYDPNMVQNPQY